MAEVALNGLSKHYGDFYAVREFSLTIADGEFLVLLGPSGCGKTTTLRMIAGFVEPSGGTAMIGETDVTYLPPWRRNTGFGLEMRKLPRSDIASRTAEVLRLVRLDRYAERYPRQLSGGQQQRVALA